MERVPVLVVGAGPAGLATSHELAGMGVEHLVLERGRVGQTWRDRWDSFCLVTPNWSVRLPGGSYEGPDPDGYLGRDELVGHFERYALGFAAPVREGVDVTALEAGPGGRGFLARSSAGEIAADRVVVATGTYARPFLPPGARTLPAHILAMDVTRYRSPGDLPPGPVLVIGSGQTGVQLAEELFEDGRHVVLSCGKAPWLPRRINGRNMVEWAANSGFLEQPSSALPSPLARFGANFLATGHGGGHDLHYRTLSAMGVTLAGRFLGAEGTRATFAQDLPASVAWGDDRYRELRTLFSRHAAEQGLAAPEMPDPAPFTETGPASVDLSGFGAVIFTGGFRPAYADWIGRPDAFDEMGFPLQEDGASTVWPGLHFVGVHFMRKRKSSILMGMGEDAGVVAAAIAGAA